MAHGPSRIVICYNGYFVNGFKFHTKSYGNYKNSMNSGVWVTGGHNDYNNDFYDI